MGVESAAFARVAESNHVPRDLMVAIAQVEGGLAMPATRDVDPDAQVPVAGPLELRRGKTDTLAWGATLMGKSELDLRRDTDLGLEAGGRVLSALGNRTTANESDLASWQQALEELSGFSDQEHRTKYAHDVFALLARGGTFEGRDGESITITPHDLPPTLTLTIDTSVHIESGAEYPGAEWFPTSCTNKCDTTRAGNPIDYVVIHDTEGGWTASVATLQNDSGKSVQYIVNTDGHVGQFVPESYTAWHAGNYWYNQRSVGIEHVGYYTQTYPEAQYDSSSKLVAYLTKKYGVTKDRAHIIGHDQVPNGNVMAQSSPACSDSPANCEKGSNYGGSNNHRDPGDWEWCTYMPRFGGTCKCNDIWNLWNCSSDKTQAFRCTNGNVELIKCDGPGACETQPNGQNDICHQAPVVDAGTPVTDASTPPPVFHDASTPIPPPSTPTSSTQDDAGCSQAPGSRGSLFSFALMGLALLVRATRRSRVSRHH
jgi:N-acetylmuramoyl-L-alanine amidase